MQHGARTVFWCVFSLSLLCPGQALASVVLRLSDISRADLSVVLDVSEGTEVPRPAQQDLESMRPITTQARHFKLYYDPGSNTYQDRFGRLFHYRIFCVESTAGTERWIEFNVTAASTGSFLDHFEPVRFQLKSGDMEDEGIIQLPIHSLGNMDSLAVVPIPDPAVVSLSGGPIRLKLQNLLPDMAITVASKYGIRGDPSRWVHPGPNGQEQVSGEETRIEPGKSAEIYAQVTPRKMPALLATLKGLASDSSHDSVTVEFIYSSDFAGPKRTQLAAIPLRFVPSIVSLCLAWLLGVFVALLLFHFKDTVSPSRKLLVIVVRSLLTAVVAELAAIGLVAAKSKFVLFTFELDPWQILPVFLIAFVAAGGPKARALLGGLWEAAAPQPPAKAAGDKP